MECKSYIYIPCQGVEEITDLYNRVALMNYREDGVTPYITVWKHGLVGEKV